MFSRLPIVSGNAYAVHVSRSSKTQESPGEGRWCLYQIRALLRDIFINHPTRGLRAPFFAAEKSHANCTNTDAYPLIKVLAIPKNKSEGSSLVVHINIPFFEVQSNRNP